MGEFVVYPSKWRIALLALLAVGFVAIGAWMAGLLGPIPVSRHYSPIFIFVMGWAGIIFFGFCCLAIIKKFFDTREQLRIGPAGVRVPSWSDQTIPWSEITDVTTWSHRGQKFIILHLRDPSLFPGRSKAAMTAKSNRMLTGGDISITLIGTDRRLAEAMSAIAWFKR